MSTIKLVCIYHRIDLDGQCSAAIVGKWSDDHGKGQVEYVPYNYGDEIPWDRLKGNDVVMVDCSFTPDAMRRLQQEARTLTWIDHHVSAIEACEEAKVHPPGLREIGKAGCELTWQHFFQSKSIPPGVFLLGRHDVWDLEADPRVEPFQYAMRSFETEPTSSVWTALFESYGETVDAFGRSWLQDMVGIGQQIQRYQEKQDRLAAQAGAFETTITGPKGEEYRGIAINSSGRGSKSLEPVYDPERHDVMVTYRRTRKRSWAISFYAYKEEVPCHEIAKQYGGGGHQGAAGCEIKHHLLPFKH